MYLCLVYDSEFYSRLAAKKRIPQQLEFPKLLLNSTGSEFKVVHTFEVVNVEIHVRRHIFQQYYTD